MQARKKPHTILGPGIIQVVRRLSLQLLLGQRSKRSCDWSKEGRLEQCGVHSGLCVFFCRLPQLNFTPHHQQNINVEPGWIVKDVSKQKREIQRATFQPSPVQVTFGHIRHMKLILSNSWLVDITSAMNIGLKRDTTCCPMLGLRRCLFSALYTDSALYFKWGPGP